MLYATITVRSFRKQFDERLHKHLGENINNAAHVLRGAVRDSISVQGGGIPSKPGQPPRLQSGDLWRSYFVAIDFNELHARVGSDLPYSLDLELGSLHVAPRPHLRRNLYGNIRMRRALTRPML